MTFQHVVPMHVLPAWVHIAATLFLVVTLWCSAHRFAYRYEGRGGKRVALFFGITATIAMAKVGARIEGYWIDPLWVLLKFSIGVSLWGLLLLPCGDTTDAE